MKLKKSIFPLIILISLLGCNSAGPKPNYSTPPFIIDSHMHYVATDAWEKSFLEIFSRHNAMACLLMDMKDLDRGIAFAKAHPDRVIPYAEIDIENPAVLLDIQRVYDMGFKGLGELFATGNYDYNDPKYEPLWTLAEKLGMPVAPHTGNLSNGLMDHLRPAPLADVAARHPRLFIHAAHFGNPWYNEAAEATRRNRNLYFDQLLFSGP
jgi:predicted TIM-barrel fold metal-dependent hydrolase